MADWVAVLDLCRERGVRVHVTQHGRTYDTANYHDREALMNEGAKAEAFSDALSETVKDGIDIAMRAGKPLASVPFGYRRVQVRAKRATVREREQDDNYIKCGAKVTVDGQAVGLMLPRNG